MSDRREAARRRLILSGVAAVASLGFAVTAATLADRGDDTPTSGDHVNPFAGSLMPEGVPAPDFSLPDQDGRRVSMRDLRGRVVIVTFTYSVCEDSCGAQVQQVRGALDRLEDDVPALAISVDPRTDTPARARRFLLEQRATGRVRYVLGSRAQLSRVWRGFAIQPQTEDLEHQARIVLVDRRGFQRVGYPLDLATPEGIAHDVRLLERENA